MDFRQIGLTLGDVITDNAARYPDHLAYQLGTRNVSHRELRERGVRLVSAMVAAEVRRQDVVAVYSRNGIEFGEVIAATQLSGVILATINFRWSPPEVMDAVSRVRPKIVFVDNEFVATMTELIADLPEPPLLIGIGAASPDVQDYESFIATGRGDDPELIATAEDIACLIFTSGTTGSSKCCILGHRELRQMMMVVNAEMMSCSSDRALINMPMFHIGALAIIGGVHARGGTVVLQQQFDVTTAVRVISDEGISILHLAPVLLSALLDALPNSWAARSVRTVVYSAAPMNMSILKRAMERLPHAGFVNLYGQTEGVVSSLPRELHVESGDAACLKSVGFPVPGVRVRIVGEGGDDLAPGLSGEVLVQSDFMFRGYWADQAATLATLRDGWCHTGDIGFIGDRGLLYLVDRKKDVIVTGGENVYSPEVEDAVATLSGVAACAVVAIPDPRWGETVCAVVVPNAGTTVTLGDVVGGLRGRLAGYKMPRSLVVVDALPLLVSGKVDKKKLRAELARGAEVSQW